MRTVAIIQARMQSTRLPGKVLADVAGAPALFRVVERARRAITLDAVVVATSDEPADDAVARFCDAFGIEFFRGSQDDVLARYAQAAKRFRADVVVRLTGDCPLLDPRVIDRVVGTYDPARFDYVTNTLECTYPDGLDVEVMSYDALLTAEREATLSSEREHVTPYVRKHPERFRSANVRHDEDLSHLRWTLDEADDLEFVCAVYAGCGPEPFGMNEVLRLLASRPDLVEINRRFERNEGLAKSLREDQMVEGAESR